MKFEVVNDKNKTMYYTNEIKDIPSKEYLDSMSDAGYKFKIDGRVASKKKVEELKKLTKEKNNNEDTDKIPQSKHT